MNYEINSNHLPTVEAQYEALLEHEPKLITNFVPIDAAEQKQAFLDGHTVNPDHTYERLSKIDFSANAAAITEIGESLASHPDMNEKYRSSYEQCVDGYLKKTRMMELAHAFKGSAGTEREAIREEFMQLNIELYGAPDETTYRSLLQEKLRSVAEKNLEGTAADLRDELFEMAGTKESDGTIERFTPSSETMEWMHGAVETLYGGMLSHVPDNKETFTVAETQAIFSEVIKEEFGEAAEDWRADVESAKSINVKSSEKRVVIPEDRGNLSRDMLRKMIVHEIGVHVLRSITGVGTDLPLLRQGMSGYYDSEEGLGKVMEQALVGKFGEAGVDHYITAGASHFDHKDFRELFEMKWRLGVLGALAEGDELSDEAVNKAKNTAYSQTMRSLRGTDELPWFKDLSYYNGSVDMWRHLEEIRGDDLQFMFVLMGKADPSSRRHRQVLYETKTP